MELKKKWNLFWTLNRCHAEGFTLVELIVVIAILAILAGIAVPAYSGYVDKANQQADITLAREVAQALELAFYDQTLPNGGSVVLTKDGAEADGDVEAALVAVFGSVDSIAGLKYDGWNGSYDGGSFKGHETDLTGKVEGLTEALATFLANNTGEDSTALGGRFGTYMKDALGFTDDDMKDNGKVADAAVLYVANTTKNLTTAQQNALKNIGECDNVGTVFTTLVSNVYGGNMFAGTAAAYALLTGYCQTNNIPVNKVDASTIGANPTQADMMNMLTATFSGAFADGEEAFDARWAEYAKEQAGKDAAAFLDVMGAVDSAKGQVVDSLGTEGCFTSEKLSSLVSNYSSGNIVVMAQVQNGKVEITTVPSVLN